MLNQIKNVLINFFRGIFFASFFILFYSFFLEQKVSKYFSLINVMEVNSLSSKEKVLSYSAENKKIITYPNYGDKYGNIVISSIDMSLPVYYGDDLQILRYGVGQYTGSYFPGEGGTIIYAGHNNPGMFNHLDNVGINDEIIIETIYGTFKYYVINTKIINQNDLSAFNIQHDEEILIMYTCFPIDRSFSRKTERYVVYAKREGV